MKSLEIVSEVLEENDYGILGDDELNQIKADLEVLEILRKCMIRGSIIYNDLSKLYEFEMYEMFNEETSNKLKKWLEENENDK